MIAWVQRVYNKLKEHMGNYTSARASKLDNLDATISSRQPDAGLTSTHVGRIDTAISSRATPADCPDPAYYTNTRATKLDNLNATITSRASAADYTAARAAKLDNLDAPVSSAKNTVTVQRGYTYRAGSTAVGIDVAISAIDPTKSFMTVSGSGSNDYTHPAGKIVDSTTIRVGCGDMSTGTNSNQTYIYWEVVQIA